MNKTNRSLVIFYAAALMIFGGVIGYMIKANTAPSPQTLRLGRVDEIATVIRDRLSAKLDLTAQQKERIEPMIKKAAEEMEASHLDCLKKINKTADELHAQIRGELIPDQQQKLIELEKERAARMKEKYNYGLAATNMVQH